MSRVRVWVAACCFALLSQGVAAATGPGQLWLRIESSTTRDPIAGAHVVVVGSSAGAIATAISDAAGRVRLQSLIPSIYRVEVRARSYDMYVGSVEVRSGRIARLHVSLAPGLTMIANVVSHANRLPYLDVVSPNSAIRKYSPSLLEALQSLGGVQVTQVNGVGSLLAVNGQDPTSTSYSVNGVSLAGSGAGLAVNTDLLQQVSIDQANDAVSFLYLNPTQAPRYLEQISTGGFGSGLTKFSAQGTSGQIGFAFVYADRRQSSMLDGQTYEDLSGLDYRHSGDAISRGNYLKITGPVGSWSAGIQGDFSLSSTSPIPTYFAGSVPAGYGPGETIDAVTSNVVATANGSLGASGVGASISAGYWEDQSTDDARSRRIEGYALPMLSHSIATGRSIGAELMQTTPYFTQTEELSALLLSDDARITLGKAAPVENATASTDYHLSFDLTHYARNDRRFAISLEADASPGAGTDAQIVPSLRFKASARDSVTLSATYGNSIVVPVGVQPLADPAGASFDCAGKTISIPGPGDRTARPSHIGATVGWIQSQGKLQVSMLGYVRSVSGAMLTNALVPLSLEPPGFVPNSFANALATDYHTFGGCSGAAPSPDRIFIVQDVAGLSMLYGGGTFDVTRPVGRNSTLELTYNYTGAHVVGTDPRLKGSFSPYIVGQQLPNIAPQTVGVTLDTLLDRRGTEALMHFQWTSTGNQRNLPSYGQYSFALIRPLSRAASLSIVATNLSNNYAGAFVSPLNAIGLPTNSGAIFPTLASPLRPATLFAQLTFKQRHSDGF
ncbi:MAG: carboxypeptidase regulatory-like domain-containing protein [Acidiferrobacteraceae bacterium]